MRTVRFFANHLIPAIVFVMAILLSLIAAILSAAIEYSVIDGIIRNSGGNQTIYMPLLIVIVLEGSKIYLHVLFRAGKEHQLPDLTTTFLKVVLICLVAFSMICTLIWSAYMLYGNIVVDDTRIASAEEINKNYDQMVDKVSDSKTKRIQDGIAEAKKSYEEAAKRYYEYEVVLTPRYMYERSRLEKERLRNEMTDAKAELEKVEVAVIAFVQEDISTAIEEIEAQRREALSSLEEKVKNDHPGANTYLHVVLMALARYLLQLKSYSEVAYFAVTAIFALSLSLMLEALICADMHLISANEETWMKLLRSSELSEDAQVRLQKGVRLFLASFVAVLLYLVFNMLKKLDVAMEGMVIALAVAILVNILVGFASRSIKRGTDGTTSGAANVTFRKLGEEIKLMIVKGCTAFVGYIFLGAIFGATFQELTLPALGISIGSMGGHLIRIPDATSI